MKYEILLPHLPYARHAFAEQSRIELIKHPNTEESYADMVYNSSFQNYNYQF